MKIEIELPDYDGNAVDVIWENGARYAIESQECNICLKANKLGLISFAKQMLYLAYHEFPSGSHVHFDEFFTQTSSKFEFVIEKE